MRRSRRALRSLSREDHDFHFLSLRRQLVDQDPLFGPSFAGISADRIHIVEALLLGELVNPDSLQIALELHDPQTLEPFANF